MNKNDFSSISDYLNDLKSKPIFLKNLNLKELKEHEIFKESLIDDINNTEKEIYSNIKEIKNFKIKKKWLKIEIKIFKKKKEKLIKEENKNKYFKQKFLKIKLEKLKSNN